ncbi:MAG: O-methyltransferase [Bacilli bacterium]
MDNEFLIRKIEKYADENGVPIMEKESMSFLTEFIKLNNIKNVLEIGTAIGYSAINMALAGEEVNVTSIERDNKRYIEAIKNVKKLKLDNRVTLVLIDALDFKTDEKYDLIFIDAAKGQYTKFFEKFENNLIKNGFIITDNIKFHGLVGNEKDNLSRNLRQLVTKIEKYILFLKDNKIFKTRFFDVGDGLAVSKRRKNKNE